MKRSPMARGVGFKRKSATTRAPARSEAACGLADDEGSVEHQAATTLRPLCRGTYEVAPFEARKPSPKTPHRAGGVAEQQHKKRLVGLGCMCCRMALNVTTPEVELHHLRAGQGWGKGDWMTLMPLCVEHHRGATGVHGLGTKGFPKRYGFTEQDMLGVALQLLCLPADRKQSVTTERIDSATREGETL